MIKNGVLTILFTCLTVFTMMAQGTKGMYVNDFKNIIGNTDKENELLEYAQQGGFNYLLLYNLHAIQQNQFDISDPVAAQPLADFIEKAKTEYGILEVGAVGEKRSSFDKIIAYNNNFSTNPNQQFDVLNIEFEFWNNKLVTNYYCGSYLEGAGYSCDNNGAFQFYIEQIKQAHELCAALGLKSETYIGKITDSQGKELGQNCDRILVHYYRKSDQYNNGNSIYNYKSDRLSQLAPDEGILEVMPIFAATAEFMGLWLAEHSIDEAFDTYMNGQKGYNESTGSWKSRIRIDGFQWYAYTHLLQFSAVNNTGTEDEQNKRIIIEERILPNQADHGLSLQESNVKFFPNQEKESLFVQCPKEASLRLLTLQGEVLAYIGPGVPKALDFSKMNDGVYLVTLQSRGDLMVREITLKQN